MEKNYPIRLSVVDPSLTSEFVCLSSTSLPVAADCMQTDRRVLTSYSRGSSSRGAHRIRRHPPSASIDSIQGQEVKSARVYQAYGRVKRNVDTQQWGDVGRFPSNPCFRGTMDFSLLSSLQPSRRRRSSAGGGSADNIECHHYIEKIFVTNAGVELQFRH